MSGASVTVFTKVAAPGEPTTLSKRISIGTDGRVFSDGSACRMAEGIARTVSAPDAQTLARVIGNLGSKNALALGVSEHSECRVVTARALKQVNGRALNGMPVIARTREFIDYGPGPAWMLLDFDAKHMPDHLRQTIADKGGMWAVLNLLVPGLATCVHVWRASTSTGLRHIDNGPIQGSGGEHVYLLVEDGADVDRAMRALHDTCWSMGYGWHVIGSAGQLLERSLIDTAVRFGERLCFEGPPEVVLPLVQDDEARRPIAHDGPALDTRTVLPSLSAYQEARIAEAKARDQKKLEPEAAAIRGQTDLRLAEALSKRAGMPVAVAQKIVAMRHQKRLLPDVELDFDHLGIVTVGQVLRDPDRHVDETLCDPLEGAAYGRDKAKVLRDKRNPLQLMIYSFAHGGSLYRLCHNARTVGDAVDAAPQKHVVDILSSLVPQAELEADELNELVAAAAAKNGKIGRWVILARLKTERIRREQAAMRAAHEEETLADGRLLALLPPPDGALTKVVEFVDETLTADKSEEPPMRDASAAIVEVRVREPWGLHQFVATGANAEPLPDGQQALPAPPEPTLTPLSATEVTLLVERYIRFETEGTAKTPPHEGRLQRPFIEALMQFGSHSQMPEVRAIVTAPMVALNGNTIAGVGLDRSAKIVYRIEPSLLACFDLDREITTDDAKTALKFLIDEWLVDVSTKKEGKLLSIANALSKIERVLLEERPAWLFTAQQRGSGKTTLIRMINMAVFGRQTAAAAWSDNPEERRKALFSYLLQGVATVVWDNIPRGTEVSCPHIERTLTIPQDSDRILGVSKVETVATTTIMDFTGNRVSFRGDMASRGLSIDLVAGRPDPENRHFEHPDPIGWTLANRVKILEKLYILMIYAGKNRPVGQVAKTRFKTWWQLCGYPVELAAELIDEKIDIASLLSAAEKGEAETTAAGEILTVLMDAFPDAVTERNGRVDDEKKFFARDVSRLIAAGEKRSDGSEPPEDDKERADRLRDAFTDLTGKRVTRTSAGAIGKLLNSRLVGRPVFVDVKDEVTAIVAIVALRGELTRTKQASFYIEIVSKSADETDVFPNLNGLYGSPSSPSSPADRTKSPPPAGDEGDEGDNFSRPDSGETCISHKRAPVSAATPRPPTGSQFNHSARNGGPATSEDDKPTPPSRTRITL